MDLKQKHLLLASPVDAMDVKSWSGIPFSTRCALERHVGKLTVFHPGKPRRDPMNVALRLLAAGTPPRWPLVLTEATMRQNARELRAAVEASGADAVLSIQSGCIARLDPFPVPTYMFSDAPWLAWKEAYAGYEPLPLRWRAYARAEAQVAARCNGLFFASEWGVREAERLYYGGHANADQRGRIHATPLGANWLPDLSAEALHEAIRARDTQRIELLFVGRDWERKGGPLAVEVAMHLRAAGARACLHVVGCRPVLDENLTAGDEPVVRLHGELYRDVPAEREALRALFLRSHFLLVPTKAECFGIAFAEAQAFGLPPVSRDIHALPSVVIDDETGLLMPPDASAQDYAERILRLYANRERYVAMAERGIERAATVTHWDIMAQHMLRVMFPS